MSRFVLTILLIMVMLALSGGMLYFMIQKFGHVEQGKSSATDRTQPTVPLLAPDRAPDRKPVEKKPPKKADPPGDFTADMTYRDVLDRLRAAKIGSVHMAPTSGPEQMFYIGGGQADANVAATYWGTRFGSVVVENAVVCNKHASVQAAKEYAGRYEGEVANWGRFTFISSDKQPNLASQVVAALESR